MYQSEQINELAAALSKAQGELTPAVKDRNNPFFKSSYADLSSVWNACREPLSKNGLSVIQTMGQVDGQFTLITTLAHSSGQWMRSHVPIISEKNNAQGIGASITYMRRYALSAFVGITCDEDDDGNASVRMPERPKQNETKPNAQSAPTNQSINGGQLKVLQGLLAQCDQTFSENIRKYFGIISWDQLPSAKYDQALKSIHGHLQSKETASCA